MLCNLLADKPREEKKREKTKICCEREQFLSEVGDGDDYFDGDKVRSTYTPVPLESRLPVLTHAPETILAMQLNAFVPFAFPKRNEC